jgi:hypothetical protein
VPVEGSIPEEKMFMKTTITRATAALVALGALFAAMLLLAGGSQAAPGGSPSCSYPACQPTTAPVSSSSSSSTAGLEVSTTNPTAGGSITISGTSCNPGATVTATLDTGDVIGTATVGNDGTFTITGTLPSGVTGSHTITTTGGGSAHTCSGVLGVEISAPGGSGGGGLASTGVAVVGIGALGAVLLIGGGLMLMAGKRRNSKHA